MHADPMLMDLYACSAQPAHWPQTLDRLCDETGACSAVVQAFRFDGDQARPHWQAMDTRTTRGQRPPHDGDVLGDEHPDRRCAPTAGDGGHRLPLLPDLGGTRRVPTHPSEMLTLEVCERPAVGAASAMSDGWTCPS